MSNLSLVAIKAHRYAGKLRAPGDSYEARTTQDARLMKALKWAIDAQLVAPAVHVPVAQPAEPAASAVPATADSATPAAAKRGRKPRAAAAADLLSSGSSGSSGSSEPDQAAGAAETESRAAFESTSVEPATEEARQPDSPSDSADADGIE